jgi:2-iminobutanoate/2-iminopropanoate deaminase
MARKTITSEKAPIPKALYVQAVEVTGGRLLFLSGQVGRDRNEQVAKGDIVAQTRQALENIKHILEAAGGRFDQIVKVQFLVRDMAHWQTINTVRKEYFKGDLPAATFMEVNRFVDPDWMIEIDCIAALD